MKKIVLFLTLIAKICFAQVKMIPVAGTTPTSPVTGAIEYRGVSGGTFLVDTTNTFLIGAGNSKNLSTATDFAYHRYIFSSVGGRASLTTFVGSPTNTSEMYFGTDRNFLQSSSASSTSLLFQTPTSFSIQCQNAAFAGLQYDSVTANYVFSNAGNYSVPHRAYNDARYLLTNPVTGTGASGQIAFFTGATTQSGSNNHFWDNINNRLGINTTTPTTTFEVHSSQSGSGTQRGIASYQHSTFGSNTLALYKSRGTQSSPSTVTSTDSLGRLTISSYDGTNYVQNAALSLYVDGAVSSGIIPSKWEFKTANSSGVLTSGLTIDHNQNVVSTGSLTASTIIKSGGTSAQFLKADGSVDANTYLTTASASSTYLTKANPAYTGTLTTGTVGYSATNVLASVQSSVNSFNQFIIQNSNNGATASSDIVVNNDVSTNTTFYGDFGMNSSGFTGSGAFNQPSYVYLTSTSSDLAIGTTTSNSIHVVVNNGTTDAVTINTNGTTNLRVAPRVQTIATTSVVAINTDITDMYTVTSLSTATTFTTPTGTPVTGQSLIVRIKDNGTARALTFTTGTNGFRFSSDAPAPTTTTISKTMYLGFRWNEASSTWDNVSPYIDNF